MKQLIPFLLALVCLAGGAHAQQNANYDENKVPAYVLPHPLVFTNGKKVKTLKQWEGKRRSEIFRLFEDQMFGAIPPQVHFTLTKVVEESTKTPYNNAHRKQVELVLKQGDRELIVTMLMYLPANKAKVPLFLGYNFYGNHSVTRDVEVRISRAWTRNNPSIGVINNQLTEQSRGAGSDSWPIQMILDAGYGVATIFCGDVDPDRDDFTDGVHPFAYGPGQSRPAKGEWGTIAAWAWGLSEALNYLEKEAQVDASKVAVIGHSRLGKAALWAGATDRRFALVVSNNSGCGGAALSRRKFGETVKIINTSFPHWFCTNFKAYNDREESLPFDQHQLISLIAPRPVYIASAAEDQWADPRGEYLSGYHATPVYGLYGLKGLEANEMPSLHQPVMNHIGYHIRAGKHAITEYDWKQYLAFADLHLCQQKR